MKRFLSLLILLLLALSACVSPADTRETTTCATTETRAETETDVITSNAATEEQTTAERTEDTTQSPPEKTEKPTVKGYILIEPGVAMIYGSCAKDSEIKLKSDIEEFTAHSDGEYFAVAAALNEKGKTGITLAAKAYGAKESDTVSVSVKNNKNASKSNVTVTLGSRVTEKKVLPDIYGTNVMSDDEIKALKKNVQYRIRTAKKRAGKDVKTVYIIVPDPLTVYSEELTEEMNDSIVSKNARMKQVVDVLSKIDGATVIDLTETLIENKDNGKLYYKLDSHWTELGAFYGYQTVMKTLGLPYHELSDYSGDYIDIDDTDMNVYSGVGLSEMYESAPYLTAKFKEKTPYGKNKENTARIWSFVNEFFSGRQSRTDIGEDGPTAMFLFDSYGLNIIPYLAEHFKTFVTQPIWSYSVDYSLVSEIEPDYIIELLAERDLNELLTGT